MAFDGSLGVTGAGYEMQGFAGFNMPDLKSEEIVDAHVHPGSRAIDGKGADGTEEWAHGRDFTLAGHVHHGQSGGMPIRKKGAGSVQADQRVVGGPMPIQGLQDFPAFGLDDVPMGAFERGKKQEPSFGGDRGAVTAAGIRTLPEETIRPKIITGERLEGADVQPLVRGIRHDSFDVHRNSAGVQSSTRDAPKTPVAVVRIQYEDAVSAVLQIVPDARHGDIQTTFHRTRPQGAGKHRRDKNPSQQERPGKHGARLTGRRRVASPGAASRRPMGEPGAYLAVTWIRTASRLVVSPPEIAVT